MRKLIWITIAGTLGCTTTRRYAAADGSEYFRVECSGRQTTYEICKRKASRHCDNYEVLDSNGKVIATDKTPHEKMRNASIAEKKKYMFFRCADTSSAVASDAAVIMPGLD
jgi:hypothetical protein